MVVLDRLRTENVLKDFYLAGGTALAGFYLGHRLSEDLDFFTTLPQAVARIPPLIRRVAKTLKARVSLGRRFETLFECNLISSREERVEMDFALDMPGRLQPTRLSKEIS
jgi:predicted nucleotidyltransferase component of viral defense system